MDEEEVFARVVDVLWTQHGGSGLRGPTWTEAWDLEWDELTRLIDEINRRRSAEATAIRRAQKG